MCKAKELLLIIEATWFLLNNKFDDLKIDCEMRVGCWQNMIFQTLFNNWDLMSTNGVEFLMLPFIHQVKNMK